MWCAFTTALYKSNKNFWQFKISYFAYLKINTLVWKGENQDDIISLRGKGEKLKFAVKPKQREIYMSHFLLTIIPLKAVLALASTWQDGGPEVELDITVGEKVPEETVGRGRGGTSVPARLWLEAGTEGGAGRKPSTQESCK